MRKNLWPNPRNLAPDADQSWGQWQIYGGGPTVANTTSKWLAPVQSSVLITWANPTVAEGGNVGSTLNGLTVGSVYTASAWVYVPTGSPAVQLNAYFNVSGPTSTVYDQWQQLAVTFTASGTTQAITVVNTVAVASAGLTCCVAGALCEAGSSVLGGYFDGGFVSCMWNADGTSTFGATAMPRTNLCINSRGTSLTGWLAGYGGGTGSITWQSDATAPSGMSLVYTQTTAATGGSYVYYRVTQEGFVPGSTYTVSSYVKPSMDMTLRGATEMYSATTNLLTTFGPQVFCPAGQWTELYTTTPAPAGSVYILAFPWDTNGGGPVLPTGATIGMSAPLVEQASSVLPYFDGTYPNAAFVGLSTTALQSNSLACSQQLASGVQQNPNMPAIQIAASPSQVYGTSNGVTPGSPIGTYALWFLSDRTLKMTSQRGRTFELDNDSTGTLSLTLDNSDGSITDILDIGIQLAVTAVWQGISYPIFSGGIGDLPDLADTAANSKSEMVVNDCLDNLANYIMASILEETAIADGADYFISCDHYGAYGAYMRSATDAPGANYDAALVWFNEGNSTSTVVNSFGNSSIVTNGGPCWKLSNLWKVGTANPRGTQLQISGPNNNFGYSIYMGNNWAFEMCAATGITSSSPATVSDATIFAASDMTGWTFFGYGPTVRIAFEPSTYTGSYADSTTGYVVAYFGNGAPPIVSQSLTATQMGAGVHIVLMRDPSNTQIIHLIVNGVDNAKTSSYYSTLTSYSEWISIGECYTSGQITGGTHDANTWVSICNVGVWGGGNPTPTVAEMKEHYQAFLAYPNEPAMKRIERIIGWACQGTVTQIPDTGGMIDGVALAAMPDTSNTDALSTIQSITSSMQSRLFFGKDNTCYYGDRGWQVGNVTPKVTFGSGAGQIPWTGMPKITKDTSHLYNNVQVSTQGANQPDIYVNRSSIAKYGSRVLSVSSQLSSSLNSYSMAGYLCGRYGTPIDRITTLTIDVGANPSLFPSVLGLEIGDLVSVDYSTYARTEVMSLIVDRISHNITESSWTVSFELTPHFEYWLLAAGHTTFKSAMAVGTTTATLNPWPDSAYTPGETELEVGQKVTLSPGTANSETLTVALITTSNPGSTGYSSATVTFTTAATKAHAIGDYLSDVLPSGITDPTVYDPYSINGTTDIPQWG